MLVPLIQIIIEIILTVTLIIALGFGIYIVVTLKNIGQVINRLEKTRSEALTILRETDHELNKLKIKTEILKSSIKKTVLPRRNDIKTDADAEEMSIKDRKDGT